MNEISLRNKINSLKKDLKNSQNKDIDQLKIKAYSSFLVLAQNIAKDDGNRKIKEEDIFNAIKKEIKMANQSKNSGAPFNPFIEEIGNSILPKKMTKEETEIAVEVMIDNNFPNFNKKDFGKVMKQLSSEYGEMIDKKIASDILKNKY